MNKRKIIPVQKETKPEFSLNEYFGKDVFEKAADLFNYISVPVFRKKDTGITGRHFQWWTDEKVLDVNNNKAGRLTLVEFVWVKMVKDLRAFNVPLPLIALFKKKLFESIKIEGLPNKKEQLKDYLDKLDIPIEEKNKLLGILKTGSYQKRTDTGVNILQLLIIESILKRKPLGMAFFADGSYLIIDTEKQHLYTKKKIDLLNNGNYIRISVSNILSEYLRSDLAFKTVPEIRLLTHPENKLYEAIQTGEYESIVIHFKDKKIKVLELKKNANVQKKIVDILSEGLFAEITVKKHKGIVTKIEQNIKIAF